MRKSSGAGAGYYCVLPCALRTCGYGCALFHIHSGAQKSEPALDKPRGGDVSSESSASSAVITFVLFLPPNDQTVAILRAIILLLVTSWERYCLVPFQASLSVRWMAVCSTKTPFFQKISRLRVPSRSVPIHHAHALMFSMVQGNQSVLRPLAPSYPTY